MVPHGAGDAQLKRTPAATWRSVPAVGVSLIYPPVSSVTACRSGVHIDDGESVIPVRGAYARKQCVGMEQTYRTDSSARVKNVERGRAK